MICDFIGMSQTCNHDSFNCIDLKSIRLPYLLLFVSALLFLQCERIKENILPHTELIFPLEEGKFRISVVYDTTFTTAGINNPSTEAYYKKESNGNKEEDLLGREVTLLQVERSDFDRGTDFDFTPTRVWSQYTPAEEEDSFFAERIEENQRILVLKFPVFTNISWNGNQFNTEGTEEFYYANVDTTVTVQGKTFENCVMVMQENVDGLIRKSLKYEIYAPNVGLIKKYINTIVNDGPPGEEFNPDESRIYLEEIVEHN